MPIKNEKVARAWYYGAEAQNHKGTFWTDGRNLYSYALCIGTTVGDQKILADFTAQSGHFISTSTAKHVGKARDWASEVMNPTVFKLTIQQG